MSDNNKAVLAKKQAELKKKKIILHNNEEGYDKRKAQASALIQKGKLTDSEKETLSVLQSKIEKYPGIIAKNKEYIATLEKEISELKKIVGKKNKNSEPEAKKAHKETNTGESTSKKPVPAKSAKTKVIKVKKCTTTKCEPKPKPPKPKNKVEFIGDICITIDHLNTHSKPNTLQFAKMFADKGIPVTVFVQPTHTQKILSTKIAKIEIKGVTQKNRKPISTFSPEQLEMIKALRKVTNVRLGVHLLGSDDIKNLPLNIAQQKQIDNIKYIKSIIGNVSTASYHGAYAGLVSSTHIPQVQNSFTKIRGTDDGTRMDKKTGKIVKYIPNNIKYTLVYYSTNKIEKGKVTHFFFHAKEYEKNKTLIKNLISGVTNAKKGSNRALPY